MTALGWWLALAVVVAVTATVRAVWRDHHRATGAEARAAVAEAAAQQWEHRAGQLEDYLGRLEQSHAASVAEWADRCRAANAVAIALDIEERTS